MFSPFSIHAIVPVLTVQQAAGGPVTGTLASTEATDAANMSVGVMGSSPKTFYFLNTTAVTPDWMGRLQDGGTAPTAANSAFGWAPAKTAVTTPYFAGRIGATGTVTTAASASTIATDTHPTQGTGSSNTTAGDSFRSQNSYSGAFFGYFVPGNWTFNFAFRASTAGAVGHPNFRVWASTDPNGQTGTRELTSGSITSAGIITLSTTTTTYTSTATWAAPQTNLNNGEYLFVQVEWQETTAGSANNANVLFYQSAATITTPSFQALVSGTLASTEATDTLAIAGQVIPVATGTLASTEATDTAAFPSVVSSFPPVIYVPAQSGVGTNGSATVTSYTYTLPAAISPGNSVFLSIGGTSGGSDFTGITVNDNAGNSYHISQTGFYGAAGFALASFYGLRLQGSPTTITVNYPYAVTYASVKVDTFSSLGSFGATGTSTPWNFQTTPGTAIGAITTNNFTPPAIGDLIWTITLDAGSNGGISGSSAYQECQYLQNTWYSQWALASSTTPQTATWSSTAGATGYYASTATVIAPLGFEATLASTDPTDTSAIAGTVAWSGTLAATDIIDKAAIAGTVVNDGTLSSTEALDGAGFAGTVATLGTFSVTDIPDTMTSGAGSVAWITQFNLTDPTDTSAMSGTVTSGVISGALSTTEDSVDTAAIAGTVTGVAGALASTDTIDTSAAAGTVAWLGTLNAVDITDTSAISGQVVSSGALVATDITDTSATTGQVTWLGTLATTDTSDVSTITGLAAALGTLSSTDIIDTSAIAAVVFNVVSGTLAQTDLIDTANIPGTVLTGDAGGFNTIDPTDTAAITGSVTGVAGALASTEAIDTAAGAGAVAWVATLASTDPTDAAAIVGQAAWAGTLSTTEALDTASLAGVAAWSLSLAATDAPDMAALVGAVFVPVTGVLATTEHPDQGTFSGLVLTGIGGGLVTTDPPDSAALSGTTGWTFVLAAIDPTDIALFVGEVFAIADAVVIAGDQALYVCVGNDLPLNGVPDDEVVCTAGDYALYRCLASDQAVGGGMPEPQDRALDLVLA